MAYRFIVLLLVGCASAPKTAQGPTSDGAPTVPSAEGSRFKADLDAVRVNSKTAPAWMANGAGCVAGKSAVVSDEGAELIPAQLCVGLQSEAQLSPSTCRGAERQALGHLGLLLGLSDRVQRDSDGLRFGEQRVAIAGLAFEASWRGDFRGEPTCAVQLAIPEGVIGHLKSSWARQRGVQLERFELAVGKNDCAVIEQVGEALAKIPGQDLALQGRVEEAQKNLCRSDRAVALDLACALHSGSSDCPTGLAAKLGAAVVAAGMEQSDAGDARARFLATLRLKSEAVGQRGKLRFCRVHLSARIVDRRSNNAVENLVLSKKSGGLSDDQCIGKATNLVMKSGSAQLQKAFSR